MFVVLVCINKEDTIFHFPGFKIFIDTITLLRKEPYIISKKNAVVKTILG